MTLEGYMFVGLIADIATAVGVFLVAYYLAPVKRQSKRRK